MPSPHLFTDVGLHQQPCAAGWELPPLRLAEFHSKCPLASYTVTSEACFLDPNPQKNDQVSKKHGEYSSLPHMEDWRAWCHWGGWALRPLCYWILADPIPNRIGSCGTPSANLSDSFPSSPSFHHCPSCSFRPQWSLCSADGRNPSVREWEKHKKKTEVLVQCICGQI